MIVVNGGAENEIETAFATAVQQGAGAVYIGDDAVLNGRREQVAELKTARLIGIPEVARELSIPASIHSPLAASGRGGVFT